MKVETMKKLKTTEQPETSHQVAAVVRWQFEGRPLKTVCPESLETGLISGDLYWTRLPISPLSFRREHKTKACASVTETANWARLDFNDDYGTASTLVMHGMDRDWLERAKAALRRGGLL